MHTFKHIYLIPKNKITVKNNKLNLRENMERYTTVNNHDFR